ncbi:MAG TPA: apolipoprotein N-acyltransferase [Ferrovibrio sp.]|uniref:apolipoprotein N-acyltransferase n=1 Tax=Ferrovibrio sp. TaxID=1917215 RepID=UPI002ED6BA5D
MIRLDKIVARLQGLAGWRRYLLATVLGALLAAAQAPLFLWPLAFVALVALLWLNDKAGQGRRALQTVYLFAYGYFVAGLYWIGIAFFVDAERFAWLLPLPVLGLPLLLALFPAGGAWLGYRLAGNGGPWRMLLFAAGWTIGEWLRSFVLTGFPWNLIAYIWAGWPAAMQTASVIGSHGLGLLTLLAAAGLTLALQPGASRRYRLVALGLPLVLALSIGAGALRLRTATDATVPGVQLRLVQPSLPQTLKWRDDLRQKNLQSHIDLTLAPGKAAPTHVIWPETAVPYLLDEADGLRQALGRLVPRGGALITGAIRRSHDEQQRLVLYNSLFVLDDAGHIAARYDKQHLVPFGEYLPLRKWLHPFGLDALAAGSVDFSDGGPVEAIRIPGLPLSRALICYEVIFPDEIVPGAMPRPGLLLNITNDAWFGLSSGPYQHFAAARMRAVEQGLPLVRAANDGISAIVDSYGRVVGQLGLEAVGVLDGPLPAALPAPTLYARFGDWPALALCLLLALVGLSRKSLVK